LRLVGLGGLSALLCARHLEVEIHQLLFIVQDAELQHEFLVVRNNLLAVQLSHNKEKPCVVQLNLIDHLYHCSVCHFLN
jgi:hypothetical protein